MKTKVTQTSIDAYKELEASGDLKTQREICLSKGRELKKFCRAKLAEELKWDKSTVSARVNKLIEQNKFKVIGKVFYKPSKKYVQLLEAV